MESSKKRGGSFTVCTTDARSVKPLLQKLIEENKGWKETLIRDNYDFKWFGSTVEDAECKNSFFKRNSG